MLRRRRSIRHAHQSSAAATTPRGRMRHWRGLCQGVFVAGALATGLSAGVTHADEGQWMPTQLGELGGKLSALGATVTPDDLWRADGGILRASVNVSGCSGAFVSAQGLLGTNHHCAYGAIQAASTPEHDYLRDGFVAASKKDELPAPDRTVKVVEQITDVTVDVRAALKGKSGAAAARAVREKMAAIEAACEKAAPDRVCQVRAFNAGGLFLQFTMLELQDVRLVYAPPSSVGNFGGEVDNWMWPRHAADVAFLRAYVSKDGKPVPYSPDNVPYVPKHKLTVSAEGVRAGDFVAVLGYPGHTDRQLPLAEVKRQVGAVLPGIVEVYGALIHTLESAPGREKGKRAHAVRLKVANKLRGLQNRHKNARGMLEGITRMGLLARRTAEERQIDTWLTAHDGAGVRDALADNAARREALMMTRMGQRLAGYTTDSVGAAVRLVRWVRESKKPDTARAHGYHDKDKQRLKSRLLRHVRDYDPAVDQALLATLDRHGAGLGSITAALPVVLKRSKLMTKPSMEKAIAAAFAGTLKVDGPGTDPLLKAAGPLVDAIEAREQAEDAIWAKKLAFGPTYFKGLTAVRDGAVYPDANGTLRVSMGTVKGYAPRDGLFATPHTTLSGLLAKNTGTAPFNAPAALAEAASSRAKSPYFDKALRDVPVNFLSNNDTTGGNSGSPVIDGRGRLVGFNFDRVWENIAGDFGYQVDRSRNVMVDMRYVLWLLTAVSGGQHIADEMAPVMPGAASKGGAPGKAGAAGNTGTRKGKASAAKPAAAPQPAGGCASTTQTPGVLAALGLAMLAWRRRR